MSNFVLSRPEIVAVVPTASAYSCSTYTLLMTTASANTLGSVRELSFEVTGETLKATSSKANDAVVATSVAGNAASITVQLEEITSSAHKYLWGMTTSGSDLYTDGSGGTPTDYAIISYPWFVDGCANVMVAYKCNIQPASSRTLGREQQVMELKADVLVDPSASASKRYFGLFQKA